MANTTTKPAETQTPPSAESEPGDRVLAPEERIKVRGAREEVLKQISGSLTDVYAQGDLDQLRSEWDG